MRAGWPMGRGIAVTLRAGTLLAVVGVGLGLAWAWLGGHPAGPEAPLLGVLVRGGPDGLIGAGILVLTLTPLAALAVAATWLWRAGERAGRMAIVTLVLLAGSLIIAAVLAGAV